MCEAPPENIFCEEVKEAISLPAEVNGQECSSMFLDFLNEKYQKYSELQKKMKEDIILVSANIDEDIEKYRSVASQELAMIREDIDEEGLGITTFEDLEELAKQNEKHRLEAEKILRELTLDLELLEQSRSEETKKVMSKFKEDAFKLKHFSSNQIENCLEAEIIDVNTQIFENFQNVEDIKFRLQIQMDDIINTSNQTLIERTKAITEQHELMLRKEVNKKRGMDILSEAMTSLNQKKEEAREIFTNITADLFQQMADFPSSFELPEEYDSKDDFWKHWMRSLNKKLEVLDKLCKNVSGLLNKSANALVETFEEQISAITLKVHLQVEELSDDLSENEETKFTDKFNIMSNNTTEMLKGLRDSWKKTVEKIKIEIDHARNIVTDFTLLWTNHLARFDKIRKSIKETEAKSFVALTKNENSKMKLIRSKTKAAREAKDLKKLDDLCNKLEETYYQEVDKWDQSFLSQKEWVEHVKKVEFENLIMEIVRDIKHLLYEKYPKLDRFSESLSSKPRHSKDEYPPAKESLTSEMRTDSYNLYLQAVENRCLGMYEMMERYLPQCAVILREEAEDWMYSHIMQVLVPVYDTRIRELKETAQREVNHVRKVRFAEIQLHAERSVSHSMAVREELSSLQERMKAVEENIKSVLKEFNDHIVQDTEKPLRSRIFVLQNKWQSIAEKLEENVLEAKTHFEAKIEVLSSSNEKFLDIAKSFKAGGNYSPEELKALKKQLAIVSKSVVTQKKSLTNKYNELLNNIKSPVLESKMQEIQEELKGTNLNQDISDKLDTLRMRLRTEVQIMKSKNQDLERHIITFSKVRKVDDTYTKDIISKIDSIVNYMKFPEHMQSLECTEDKQDSIPSVDTVLTKKTPKSTKKVNKVQPLKLKPLLKNTNKLDEVSNDNNFFSKTKDLILNKYDLLIEMIQKAHSSNQAEKNKSGSTKTNNFEKDYNEIELPQQIQKIKTVLRAYNFECETAWYFECKRFFQLVRQFRTNCNELTNSILECVHQQYMNKLNTLGKAFKPKKEDFCALEEAKRNKKHFPLVLAHPNHEEKLKNWKESVSNSCTAAIKTFRDMIDHYTQNLQKMHDTYVAKVKILKDHFNHVQSLVFDSEIYKPLQDNVEGIPFLKPYTLSEEDRNEDFILIPLSIWSDAEITKKGEKSTNSQGEEIKSSDNFGSIISVFEIDIQVLKTAVDWKAIENIKESALTARRFFIEEATFFKKFEADTNEWLEALETEIEQCQNLYNIEDIEKSILEKYSYKK